MNDETGIMRRIQVALSNCGARVFRNNVGKVLNAKTGEWIAYGLCIGSSDLIGWKTEIITPDMVGRKIAVFTACEVKSENGRPTEEQKAFIEAVKAAGGRAFIARSEHEASILVLEKHLGF